ncbi:AI-2E family transporter [Sporosarcina sp. CAU 1771]
MSLSAAKKNLLQTVFIKWTPALITAVMIYLVPPVALAIILAYFSAPILLAVKSVTKLPLTIATLLVMSLLLFLTSTFTYVALHGFIDIVPTIEQHLSPYTKNTDIPGKTITFLEEKIIQYGQAMLEYAITTIRTILQQLFSLFIFLVAFFFSLRESGKNKFWFLAYFPTVIRQSARRMLTAAGKLVGTFIFVELRLVFFTFIILALGFVFLKFKSPIGVAFIISLVDSLPFFGVGLFLIPMAIFFLYLGDLYIGIALVLLYIFTLVTRQIAESYMYASTFQLKPIHTFFIMASSFYLFGLVGILLTPFLLFAATKVKSHPLFTSK